jgi:acetolactate synthase I/III small subunit
VAGEEDILEQIVKQLNKLIDVIKVIDFIDEPVIERELLLAKIDTSKSNRHEIIEISDIFNAKIVSVSQKSITVEMSGNSTGIEDFLSMVKPFGIKEVVRSGAIAIAKG